MYIAPELRLVGAAQSLVLGGSPALTGSLAICTVVKNPDELEQGEENYIDNESW